MLFKEKKYNKNHPNLKFLFCPHEQHNFVSWGGLFEFREPELPALSGDFVSGREEEKVGKEPVPIMLNLLEKGAGVG